MASVVFLRGVNVGGHRTFRPSALAKALSEFDIVNLGAAGTFIVRRAVSQAKLRAELQRRLPFNTEIMICSDREVIDLVAADPFREELSGPGIVRFVSLMNKHPGKLPTLPLVMPEAGDWILKVTGVHDRFLLGVYRRQMRAISCLSQVEKRIGVPTTTRNWNTINSVVKILMPHSR